MRKCKFKDSASMGSSNFLIIMAGGVRCAIVGSHRNPISLGALYNFQTGIPDGIYGDFLFFILSSKLFNLGTGQNLPNQNESKTAAVCA